MAVTGATAIFKNLLSLTKWLRIFENKVDAPRTHIAAAAVAARVGCHPDMKTIHMSPLAYLIKFTYVK